MRRQEAELEETRRELELQERRVEWIQKRREDMEKDPFPERHF
jgi:hypothetical protein